MQRREYLALAGLATSGIAGCLGGDGTPTATERGTDPPTEPATGTATSTATAAGDSPTATDSDTPTSSPTPRARPGPITFEGDEETVTDPFSVDGGVVVIQYEYEGKTTRFKARLEDPGGQRDSSVIGEETTTGEGLWGSVPAEGEWVINVLAASDPWTITVRQPYVEEGNGESLPLSLSGGEAGDYRAIEVEGENRVQASHAGDGTFAVKAFTRTGVRHSDSILFNQKGSFQDTTTLTYNGTNWLIVQADGSWQLDIEPQ